MPMRTDCRHYESRTYGSGDSVRKCRLDLAPEAPWRCPDDCAGYERRRMDVGWQVGPLETTRPDPEPAGADVARLLDEAEDVINAAAPDILAELESKPKGRGRRGRRKKRS